MTMTSIRFAGALALIFVALVSVQGDAASSTAASVKDLADVVLEATKANPKLRAADDKRKNALIRDFASASTSTPPSTTTTTSRSLEDGGDGNDQDDYFSSNWDYNADMTNADYGFQLDAYSLKYTGCSTVETYDANQAIDASTSSVLTSKRFATFRLCPTDSCSSNRYEGCTANYGDYVVSLDQFLAAMVALNEDRVVGYCEYCQECAAVESFHKFYYETISKKTIVVSTAKQTYQSWYSANGYSDGGYGSDGAALAYYKAKKNSNSNSNYNSNNGYNGNNNNNYNSGNSYNGGSSSSNQWSNTRSSWNSGNSGSNSWSDMGQSYSNWYGKQVVNGHYNNGAFVEEWGYFSNDGNFMSLEEESVEWDEYLYGTYPDSWDEDWMGSTADEVQSCNYQYSASCYNQYETCMRVLQNEDYMAYMEYVQSQYSNNNGGNSGMTSLADFLQCTQVDQDYIEQYQQYLAWQKAMASQYAQQSNGETYTECGEDDDGCTSQYEANYDNNNNNNYENMELYIGPHCGEDGHTITLGVYTDSTCSTYTSKYSAKDILGVDVMKEHTGGSIDLFPTKCISCIADVSI